WQEIATSSIKTGSYGFVDSKDVRTRGEYIYRVAVSNSSGKAYLTPVSATGVASGVTSSGVILSGKANRGACPMAVNFEYGTTADYGSTTASQSIGSGTGAVSLAATIGSLSSSTTYHYRVVVRDCGGTSYGVDQT